MNKNDIVGYLLLNNRIIKNKRAYWNCTCSLCGTSKDIREDSLFSNKVVSCGCYKKTIDFSNKSKLLHPIEDLSGNVYGELTVLYLSDNRNNKQILWVCLCSCGNIVEIQAGNLKNGNSKTCGAFIHRKNYMEKVWKQTLEDLTGKIYGDWVVISRDGNLQPTKWICKCQNCGTIKSVYGNFLKSGQSTGCGCRRHHATLEGQKIAHWHVGKRDKRKRPNGHFCTTYHCVCDCGTKRIVDESRLLNGTSQSCGCINSKGNEHITNLLNGNNIKFIPEYKYKELKGPNEGLLRFDFAILDDDGKVVCLIEYQGEQHYKDTDFGRIQREITDKSKRIFCKSNNIPLFEIAYTDNIDEKMDKILSHIAC